MHRGEDFPADLVFLAAGGDDAWQRSVCYVQTMQVVVHVGLVFVGCAVSDRYFAIPPRARP